MSLIKKHNFLDGKHSYDLPFSGTLDVIKLDIVETLFPQCPKVLNSMDFTNLHKYPSLADIQTLEILVSKYLFPEDYLSTEKTEKGEGLKGRGFPPSPFY